jgi:iron-sulfur cluster repair protein YtfE (RIC family)
MTSPTQPLRDEHRALLPRAERLRTAAEAVTQLPTVGVGAAVDAALAFLKDDLLPHAAAEDRVFYPAVQRAMGAPGATATMRRDHAEVVRLTAELAALRGRIGHRWLAPADAEALRRVLYGLHALVGLHFAKEEEVYLPLLDARLGPAEAGALFAAMEAAAAAAKAR